MRRGLLLEDFNSRHAARLNPAKGSRLGAQGILVVVVPLLKNLGLKKVLFIESLFEGRHYAKCTICIILFTLGTGVMRSVLKIIRLECS